MSYQSHKILLFNSFVVIQVTLSKIWKVILRNIKNACSSFHEKALESPKCEVGEEKADSFSGFSEE